MYCAAEYRGLRRRVRFTVRLRLSRYGLVLTFVQFFKMSKLNGRYGHRGFVQDRNKLMYFSYRMPVDAHIWLSFNKCSNKRAYDPQAGLNLILAA